VTDNDGHVCILGAVNMAVHETEWGWGMEYPVATVLFAASAVLASRDRRSWRHLPDAVVWNNEDSTTGEDVVLLLKQAAELLEGE